MKLLEKMLIILCISTLVLGTACSQNAGGGKDQDAGDGSAQNADKAVSLRFSWWGGDERHQATLAAIDAYTQNNPNVTIEAEFGGYDGYDEKLATQISGGTMADIIQIVPQKLLEFGSKSDVFVDYNTQDIVRLDGFDMDFTNSFGTVDGKLLGLPTGINAYGLVVNKVAFEKAGMEVPETMTWDDFFTLGQQMHQADPNLYLWTADNDDWNHLMRSYLRQKIGEWPITSDYTVTEDKAALVEAFTLVKDMADKGVSEPMETAYPYYGKIWENKKWHNGEIGMMYQATARLGQYKSDNTDLVTINIPQMDGAKKTGVITQPAQMIAVTKTGNEQEALAFVDYFYNNSEAIEILTDVRSVPPTEAARQQLADSGKLNPLVSKAVNDALAITDDPVPGASENSEVYRILFELWEQVCFDKITPEAAADKYIADITRLMGEIQP